MQGNFLHSLLKIVALKERSLLKMCIFRNGPVPVSLWCIVGAILRYATCAYSLWYWNELKRLPQINYKYEFYRKLKEFDHKILIEISSCHVCSYNGSCMSGDRHTLETSIWKLLIFLLIIQIFMYQTYLNFVFKRKI